MTDLYSQEAPANAIAVYNAKKGEFEWQVQEENIKFKKDFTLRIKKSENYDVHWNRQIVDPDDKVIFDSSESFKTKKQALSAGNKIITLIKVMLDPRYQKEE